LQFIPTPNPRFPDQLCTYDPQTEILYTKLFGAHICGDQVLDEGWETFNEDHYYDCLMAPHARQVETALDKLSELVRIYARSWSLVRYGLLNSPKLPLQSAAKQLRYNGSAALCLRLWKYGNFLAQALVASPGVGVESINCEVGWSQLRSSSRRKSAGFVIGSPTLAVMRPPRFKTALHCPIHRYQQQTGVFGLYGWSEKLT